ncbi:MAG: hypothetical protein RLZZ501_485 [Pseudomonadota bacterium]|jgi:magnesium chelatase accessory protein
MMRSRLIWDKDGRDWPNRQASRFVHAGGLTWHVQIAGSGPVMVLIHGTGAATHSWAGLFPLLARDFTVVAADMPGHGFTTRPAPSHLSLPGMARSHAALLHELQVAPELVVGHSAGAAILIRMCLDGMIAPRAVISLGGALLPLDGMTQRVFSPLAKLMAALPHPPYLFALRARYTSMVDDLMKGTGSVLQPETVELYRRLGTSPQHVGSAIAMMANWDLKPLRHDLPRLAPHLVLASGSNDRTIPPTVARKVHAMVPGSELAIFDGLGHLAHEERPEVVYALIRRVAGLPEA